jgi:osmoprotectant transport system substrate-binding protein
MKWTAMAAALLCLALAAGPAAAGDRGPVTVGSKIDTEGALLGQMMVLSLEAKGFQVEDRTEFGPTNIVRKALLTGQIDIYPEYTGNGGFFFPTADSGVWKSFEKGYQTVKRLDRKQHGVVWLQPAKANNTWAIAVRQDLAREHGLKGLDDLAPYLAKGGRFKLACSEEFVNRPDALPAFQEAYGFELKPEQLLVFSGGNTSQTERAAAQGINGVNAAMAYGTDGALAALGLVVLEDTKGVQPVYAPAPIARGEVLERFPEIAAILEPVFASLDLEILQRLNAAIALEGRPARDVARGHLESQGLL